MSWFSTLAVTNMLTVSLVLMNLTGKKKKEKRKGVTFLTNSTQMISTTTVKMLQKSKNVLGGAGGENSLFLDGA